MGKEAAPRRRLVRRILVTASGIAVLAAVIFAVSAISSPKRPAESKSAALEVPSTTQASQLADQARSAQSRNDTETARVLAQSALKLDSGNVVAQKVIADLDRSVSATKPEAASKPAAPKPAAPKPAASAVAAAGPYGSAVASVGKLLPTTITDWTAGAPVVRGGEGLVTFEPKRATSSYRSVVRATFSVHDRKTSAAAASFLTKVDKTLYASDGGTAKVDAVSGHFGTDGAQLAAFAFTRGRYAFEVVLYARPGTKPATLKPLALKLADSLPATH